jgi:hypothetical protein
MSAAHTQGKLIYWACRVDNRTTPPMYDYLQFAVAPHKKHVFRVPIGSTNESIALRIAACWNACEGVPTEVLQANQSGGLPWNVADQIEQRVLHAELLEALKNLAAIANDSCIGPWDQARAAIAKAEGKT